MLFNSYSFVFLFLPVVIVIFFIIARGAKQLAALWLGVASLFFYGWWNPQFVLLLISSIIFNFFISNMIAETLTKKKSLIQAKTILIIAISSNLFVLGYFKYADFFISSANSFANQHWVLLHITLPLGISFFTFTQISFLVDVYRNQAREYSFIHYLLFVTYFPHLIAGPVLHHKQMMPQFAKMETYQLNIANINQGLTIFTFGLIKKVIIADKFAAYANPVFSPQNLSVQLDFYTAWIGSLAYTLQLYFDFSAYSDMAIGLSLLFNIKLPANFNSPYKAINIIEFWRRWHITLSAFLKDYVYIYLGGNRRGFVRWYVNLFLTMLIGGLWHGANWTFVLWGGLHGAYLIINHLWQALSDRFQFPSVYGSRVFSRLLTFLAVVFAWVLFRADSVEVACNIITSMLSINSLGKLPDSGLKSQLMWLFLGLFIVWFMPNVQQIIKTMEHKVYSSRVNGALVGVLLLIAILSFTKTSPFIYFQF
ncbi:MAG: MBOAT family protein [Methylophilaceae bacterium]